MALRVAFEQRPQMHPMISTDRQTGRNYVDFDKLDYWTREPKSLRNHKRNTALLLHPPGFQYVTKSLGGLGNRISIQSLIVLSQHPYISTTNLGVLISVTKL